jgi:FkbM family methyltransferase
MRGGLKWLADEGIQINTVLDVGASNGSWSSECMVFYPDAKYVLFEPQPVHSDVLDHFANGCKQSVSLVKKAVGSSEGYTLFDAEDPFGGALVEKEGENTIKVDLTTIDSTLLEIRTEAPYLLKLDTHGFEKSILSGSNRTLEKCEVLIIEAYNFRITEEAFLFWELCTYLVERGFRPVDLVDVLHRTHDNSLWQMDLIFIRDTWKGFDYISYK